ncbi:MAG TPA: glycoside hydrolase family 20 zincin-like fold domain-containing protein [Armatimonadota bacterium]|jgi:hypothetical protein
MRTTLCAAVLLLAAPALAQKPMLELKNKDLRFTAGKGSDMRLELRGVPVFREQSLFIIKPGWTGVYLYQDDEPPVCATISPTEGTANFDTEKAFAHYRFTLADNSFTMRLTYGSKTAPPTEAQVHTYLNANLFSGAAYTANKGRKGSVPAAAMDMNRNNILDDVTGATFNTKLGPVEIVVEGDTTGFSLDDYRAGEAEWARKNPMIWLGANVKDFPSPGEKTMTLTFRFRPPASASVSAKAITALTAVVPTKTARVPWVSDAPIIPRPKQAAYPAQAPVRLPAVVSIAIPAGASAEERQAAAEIQTDLNELWGVASKVSERDAKDWKGFLNDADIVLAGPAASAAAALKDHAEGYSLKTDGRRAVILGADARGVYNGAQTLKQLIRVDAKGVYVKPANIVDWPTLGVRGVHWFGGRNSLPFHTKMIERILAPYKMNTMLYEVDFADFSALKNHDATRGMSLADVRKTVDLARSRFIEPIPEIESFGNSDWLFANDQNKDIQWAGRERSYDPHNPKSFETLFACYQEAIDIFQPKYFHIGHDEMTVGDKAIPPPGEKMSAVDLITESATRLNNWLKAKNLVTMMWGDTLLHFPDDCSDAGTAKRWDDAKAQRKAIPKDIIIADWHYDGDDKSFHSVPILQDLGFKVIGCTWFDRNNIRNFAAALARDKALGMIQTTWAGWVMDEDIVKGSLGYQFVAYVLAAEHEWNGGKYSLEELGWEPEEVFTRAWERKPVDRSIRPGFTVGFQTAPGASKPAAKSLAGIAFNASSPIILAGGLEKAGAPVSVTLPIGNRTAKELQFLWSTTVPTDMGTAVANLTVKYKDGQTVDVPVLYGAAIFAASDQRAGKETVTVSRTKTKAGPASTRRWAWANPRPEAPIASLTLTSARTEAAPVLQGLTGVN